MKEIPNIFATEDTYHSAPLIKKSSILNTGKFYWKLVKVIYKSNRLAKKNEFDGYQYVNSSIQLIRGFESCGINFHFEGMKNLQKFDGPAVFIGNHMSSLETVALPGIIHPIKKVVFVVKHELTTYPLFGPVNNAIDPIVVGRANPRDDLRIVMEGGAARLKAGKSIILFPQRTRSFKFDTSAFNTLGVKLAVKNNVPAVPIALVTDAWGYGKIIKDFGKINPALHVHIAIGEPINVTGNGSEAQKVVIGFIESKLKEWGREHYLVSSSK
ncbi:MAG: 1-acyl-sn-glycerol-3-phosphate acyltransferase [Bacteroidetes bacterium]|nr:1-acyl-sn-glycerol-3-phosphate acyltransferase [Bacteroidota bacterium]MBU1677973.1 1-acyl-sn-glycerol-3-phosphate acyltransferase [Bacteroidota bacterium]